MLPQVLSLFYYYSINYLTNGMSGEFESQDELTLKEVIVKLHRWIFFLLSKWIIILCFILLGTGGGLYYSLNSRPVFTAKCTFVLEGGSSSGSGASGLASLIGIDLQSSSGVFQAQNILALYQSRLMIEKTLFTLVPYKNEKVQLLDLYLRMSNMAQSWNGLPESIRASTLKSVVSNIEKNLLKVESEELITVTVKAQDEFFAKTFAETIVDNVNQFYIETKAKKSLDALRILQHQADSIKGVLNRAMTGAAAAIDAYPNANQGLQVLRVPSQKKQIDVQTSSAIYSEVVKNLESTKMALRREMPLIQIVDRPSFPLDKSQANPVAFGFIGGILGGLFIIGGLTLTKLFHKIME